MKSENITNLISMWIAKFPCMTKEEVDYIEDVLKWTDVKKTAFMMAKRLFEEQDTEE